MGVIGRHSQFQQEKSTMPKILRGLNVILINADLWGRIVKELNTTFIYPSFKSNSNGNVKSELEGKILKDGKEFRNLCSNPTPGLVSRKNENSNLKSYMCPNVHSSTIYNSQDISSVQSLTGVQLFVTPWTAARQTSLSITNSWVYSNSCPLSRWWHPTISSTVVHVSCLIQSLPASGSFLMSQLFTLGGHNIGASTSVLQLKT